MRFDRRIPPVSSKNAALVTLLMNLQLVDHLPDVRHLGSKLFGLLALRSVLHASRQCEHGVLRIEVNRQFVQVMSDQCCLVVVLDPVVEI